MLLVSDLGLSHRHGVYESEEFLKVEGVALTSLFSTVFTDENELGFFGVC